MGTKKSIVLLAVVIVCIFIISSCAQQDAITKPSEENIVFLGPQQVLQSAINQEFSYSFCQPENAISGATCGALAGDTIDPTDGKPPYSFIVSASGGRLPPGLRLNLNGLLEGTPTVEGIYNFGICAKDLSGNEDCKEIEFIASKKDQPTVFPESPTDTTVEDISKPKEESMTYQVDMDIIFKHVGSTRSYTEKVALSAQKTISSPGSGWKFTGKPGEKVPMKVSIDGYQDSGCMKNGKEHKVRGTYSGSYDGNVEVFMVYYDRDDPDSQPELDISFSEIEDLPKTSFKPFVCVPTPEDVSHNALNTELLNFGGFTSKIGYRLGFLTSRKTQDGATFTSADGGTIDVTGPDADIIDGNDRVLEGYTWSGSLTVKRIS